MRAGRRSSSNVSVRIENTCPVAVEDRACASLGAAEREAPVLELLELRAPPPERREAVVTSFAEAARQLRDHLDRHEVLCELAFHPRRVVAEVAVLEQLKRRTDLVDAGRANRRGLHEERVEEARDAKTLDLTGALTEHPLFVVRVGRRDDGPRVSLAREGSRIDPDASGMVGATPLMTKPCSSHVAAP